MAVQKRKYEAAFKQEALRLLAVSGKSVRQIEDRIRHHAGSAQQVETALSTGSDHRRSETE